MHRVRRRRAGSDARQFDQARAPARVRRYTLGDEHGGDSRIGLQPRQCLIYVELPLAMPVILAGVKTAAVTTVGTATIAAFIGAGGFGERIATGLALNDNATLLAGAIPAAALALATQALFALAERRLAHRAPVAHKAAA